MDGRSITIIYDNRLKDKNLQSGWGFSCLVEYRGKKVLFDTGDDCEKTALNIVGLNKDPKDLDAIVLSHSHKDHTGGIKATRETNRECPVYAGVSITDDLRCKLEKDGSTLSLINDITKISEGIFAGPEMGRFGPREIPLTIVTDKGMTVITGCAHPGILNILKEIKRIFGKEIELVLGGSHLEFSLFPNRVVKGFKALGVRKVAPCHCTGERAIRLFEKEYGESFIDAGVGLKIDI